MVFSWRMAEELAAAHMRSIGLEDALATQGSRDRGLDVMSEWAAAQVKYQSAPVGAPAIQQLRGASNAYDYRIFYSSSGYTAAALEVAEETCVALFTFTDTNSIAPANQVATKLLATIERELEARATLKDEDQWSTVEDMNSRRMALWRSSRRRAVDGTYVRGPRLQLTDTRIAYLSHGLSLVDLDAVITWVESENTRIDNAREESNPSYGFINKYGGAEYLLTMRRRAVCFRDQVDELEEEALKRLGGGLWIGEMLADEYRLRLVESPIYWSEVEIPTGFQWLTSVCGHCRGHARGDGPNWRCDSCNRLLLA